MKARSRPLPRPLSRGSRIGIMAPAGPLDPGRLERGLATLEQAGFETLLASNLDLRIGYLAGDDQSRLLAVEELLDAGVDALVAARGGYGTMRLLAGLPWERLARWAGWVVGMSDLTALHAALATRVPFATLHGPMISGLGEAPKDAERLFRWLSGTADRVAFEFGEAAVIRPGRAVGVSVGGNLSILAALADTPFAPPYDGGVLFLEDVGEPGYRLDRLLTQLRLSRKLAGVQAVIAGQLFRCGDESPEWKSRWTELLLEFAPAAVIVDGAAFGHGSVNRSFPLGVTVEVDTWQGTITFEEA